MDGTVWKYNCDRLSVCVSIAEVLVRLHANIFLFMYLGVSSTNTNLFV